MNKYVIYCLICICVMVFCSAISLIGGSITIMVDPSKAPKDENKKPKTYTTGQLIGLMIAGIIILALAYYSIKNLHHTLTLPQKS